VEIRIIVDIEAMGGFGKKLEARLISLANESTKEVGCIEYNLHKDTKNSDRFFIYEIWKSKAHLEKHNSTMHFKHFIEGSNGTIAHIKIHFVETIN